jgi:hypothetical protein
MNNDDWFMMMESRTATLKREHREIGLMVEKMVQYGEGANWDVQHALKESIKNLCRTLPYEWSRITNKGWVKPIPQDVQNLIYKVSSQVESAFNALIEKGDFIPVFVWGAVCRVDNPTDNLQMLARHQAFITEQHLEAAYRGGVWDGEDLEILPALVGTKKTHLERGYMG